MLETPLLAVLDDKSTGLPISKELAVRDNKICARNSIRGIVGQFSEKMASDLGAVFPHTVLLVESGTVDKDTMFTNAQSELVKLSTVCSNVISWSECTKVTDFRELATRKPSIFICKLWDLCACG